MSDQEQQLLESSVQNRPVQQEEISKEEIETIQEELEQQEDEEAGYANQLAIEQELNKEKELLLNQGSSYKRPSLFKYFVLLLPLGIIKDIIDLLDMTGVGAVFAWIITKFITAAMFLIYWFTDAKQKEAKSFITDLSDNMTAAAQRIVYLEQRVQQGAKLVGKIPGLKGTSEKLLNTTKKLSNIVNKSPLGALGTGAGLDFVPYLDVMPWTTISVFWAYFIEKKLYEQASKAAQEAREQFSQ